MTGFGEMLPGLQDLRQMQAQVLQVFHGEWVMMSDSGWSTLSDVRKCLLREVSSMLVTIKFHINLGGFPYYL